MTEPATGTVSTAVGVAAIMSFMPWGISLETLILGGICYFGGAAARTCTMIGKDLEAGNPASIGRRLLALGFAFPAAAVASCLVFFAAREIGVQADVGCGGALLIAGLKGNDGLQSIVNTVQGVFSKFAGGNQK